LCYKDFRKEILHDAGLDKFDDPAPKIFQFATQKYTTENPSGFNQKLMKLEMQHQRAMDGLMKDPEGAIASIEALGQHLSEADSK
jgi:hypothetical protein